MVERLPALFARQFVLMQPAALNLVRLHFAARAID
jgi:hypothetical protein